ncbi:zinc permease [Actinomadura darangshiensis]|uniref:Zinc permease n=1 Tax=Actinomadura darangshiensis TaxID=705336 RepID=A0A4R5BB86_9ACTN|nr:ZIP family metal transporter [Actinomadura darangshiensis]TDD81916.1 zinc permease [Actinomadura darangshiensis]
MSGERIALLGAIAGFTIFLGLPLGRLRDPRPRMRTLLSAVAIGILLFLMVDVLSHAWEPIDGALGEHSAGKAVGYGAVLLAGLIVSLAGLVHFDRWIASRVRRPSAPKEGPGAATLPAAGTWTEQADTRAVADRLALLIATGIGLHNFAEGLAIGHAAASGELSLAVLLVVGFGAHNATEGFGITAPLASAGRRTSWGRLALLGLIGGGPTLAGTVIGQSLVSDTLGTAFLALAAGSILYVVIELLAVARAAAMKTVTTWGVLAGLVLGFASDAVITYAGA